MYIKTSLLYIYIYIYIYIFVDSHGKIGAEVSNWYLIFLIKKKR